MSERIQAFSRTRTRKALYPLYPWSEWMDGSIWRIKQNEDFQCAVSSMRNYLYQSARDAGMRCSISEVDSMTLEFRFQPEESA